MRGRRSASIASTSVSASCEQPIQRRAVERRSGTSPGRCERGTRPWSSRQPMVIAGQPGHRRRERRRDATPAVGYGAPSSVARVRRTLAGDLGAAGADSAAGAGSRRSSTSTAVPAPQAPIPRTIVFGAVSSRRRRARRCRRSPIIEPSPAPWSTTSTSAAQRGRTSRARASASATATPLALSPAPGRTRSSPARAAAPAPGPGAAVGISWARPPTLVPVRSPRRAGRPSTSSHTKAMASHPSQPGRPLAAGRRRRRAAGRRRRAAVDEARPAGVVVGGDDQARLASICGGPAPRRAAADDVLAGALGGQPAPERDAR